MSLAASTILSTFDCDNDAPNLSLRWDRWLARFENYLCAVNITNDARCKAMLLHHAGEKVFEIYETISDQGDQFADVKTKLNTYFRPMKDTAMSVFQFREEAQKPSETIDQYCTRLRSMGKQCEFTNVDLEIRAQILQKTCHGNLRREILKHPTWTLDDVLKEARLLET